MPHRPSRRELICEAALDLAAEGGNHTLTHQAVDARLGLARGSTSYYYRTRHALVTAAVAHLTDRSRAAFHDHLPDEPPRTSSEAASLIVDHLAMSTVERRRDVLARYALLTDAAGDDELRAGLASCLLSIPEATTLMEGLGAADPTGAGRDLVSLLEGLVFDLAYGSRAVDSRAAFDDRRAALQTVIGRWIEMLTANP
ncbi:TetR/AcrR family transcriptional regulator [Prescottella subtropica]|uniref:TetR/AcrR family transcriptional regulator n=1 Tax=Prescottella subtropica TaxID=2545757 RepID=UPI0010FA1DC2|nr:TetR/AcrR family transcriptional regulator [Prescottella subtropica]